MLERFGFRGFVCMSYITDESTPPGLARSSEVAYLGALVHLSGRLKIIIRSKEDTVVAYMNK